MLPGWSVLICIAIPRGFTAACSFSQFTLFFISAVFFCSISSFAVHNRIAVLSTAHSASGKITKRVEQAMNSRWRIFEQKKEDVLSKPLELFLLNIVFWEKNINVLISHSYIIYDILCINDINCYCSKNDIFSTVTVMFSYFNHLQSSFLMKRFIHICMFIEVNIHILLK